MNEFDRYVALALERGDDEIAVSTISKTQEHFARCLIIESTNKDKHLSLPLLLNYRSVN